MAARGYGSRASYGLCLLSSKINKVQRDHSVNRVSLGESTEMNSVIKVERELNKLFEFSKNKYLKISSVLSKIDLSAFIEDVSYSKYPLSSILKLYVFRLIKGIRNYERLKDYLQENEEEAFQIGVYKDKNNKLDIPPKRTYNFYLQNKINKEDKEQLNLLAERILSLATKNNIILDIEIVKKIIKEKKKNHDREIKEAVKLIKKLVYPQIDLKIKENGKFTTKDLLDVLVHVALTHDFTNNGSFTFREMNLDRQTPSGDLMMYHFSKFDSVVKLREMFEKILDVIFGFAKRNYNILQKRKLDIAYDIHKICYYGKNMRYICGGKYERGTSNFIQFLTCSIVVSGKRFVLDVIPIHPINSIPNLIDESLARVKNKIRVDKVYMDRGFNSAKIINILKKHKLNFLMPMVRTPTVKRQFDVYEGTPSGIVKNFQIGRGKEKALTNLILVDDKLGIKRAFICNFDIAPQFAYKLYELYGKRWGIETGYRNMEHDFKPRTTTTNYNIRLFYFLFSVCLFNLWVLINICVSLAIYGRIKDKPIVSAKLFAILLYKVQVEFNDSGG